MTWKIHRNPATQKLSPGMTQHTQASPTPQLGQTLSILDPAENYVSYRVVNVERQMMMENVERYMDYVFVERVEESDQ